MGRDILWAAAVSNGGLRRRPDFPSILGETHGARLYENRAKLMRYLETA